MKKYAGALLILCLSVVLSAITLNRISTPPSLESLTRSGEYFLFTVHYGLLNLGSASIEIVGDTLIDGVNGKLIYSVIKSNPSIPFVGNKERHYYEIIGVNDTTLYGLEFWSHTIHKQEYFDARYSFDYAEKKVIFSVFEEPVDTLELMGAAGAGPLLFYLTRHYAGLDTNVTYPVFVDNDVGIMDMIFTQSLGKVSVGYYNNDPKDAIHMYGNANLFGPFGFSGRFDVWFDTDSMRIPLETHVKVWLGSIKIRLSEYRTNENSF